MEIHFLNMESSYTYSSSLAQISPTQVWVEFWRCSRFKLKPLHDFVLGKIDIIKNRSGRRISRGKKNLGSFCLTSNLKQTERRISLFCHLSLHPHSLWWPSPQRTWTCPCGSLQTQHILWFCKTDCKAINTTQFLLNLCCTLWHDQIRADKKWQGFFWKVRDKGTNQVGAKTSCTICIHQAAEGENWDGNTLFKEWRKSFPCCIYGQILSYISIFSKLRCSFGELVYVGQSLSLWDSRNKPDHV